jgi:peptide deformylase
MKPIKLEIIQYATDYHKFLTTPSRPVDIDYWLNGDMEVFQNMLNDIKYTCTSAKGLGLAAPQVGHHLHVIVLNGKVFNQDKMICIINPKLEILNNNLLKEEEYCLSFPRLPKIVARPEEVKVTGYDESLKKKISLTGKGLGARLICHEINHLDGITLAQK